MIYVVIILLATIANISHAMQKKKRLPSAQELLAPLAKAKEDKYSMEYLAELQKLNQKLELKREKTRKKQGEWIQQVLDAARIKSSMDSLYTIKPYGSKHIKAVAIPLLHKMALKSEREHVLRFMLDHDANPNLPIFLSGITPLAYAIMGKTYANVALLMARGADPAQLSSSVRILAKNDPRLKRLIWPETDQPVNNSK
jgi:hypothetical protein